MTQEPWSIGKTVIASVAVLAVLGAFITAAIVTGEAELTALTVAVLAVLAGVAKMLKDRGGEK